MIEAQQNVQEVVQEQIPVIEEPAQIAQQPQPDEQIDTAGNPVEEHKNQRIQEDIIPEHILNPPRYKVAVNYGEDVQFEQDTFFLEGLFDENVFEPTEEEKILQELMASLTKCPKCYSYMEVIPGEIDTSVKMPDGKELAKPAQIHFSEFRVRCFNCHDNFCTKCRASPYHLGYDCEQWEFQKNLAKCRFCSEMMVDLPLNPLPAFKHVCRNEACIKLCDTVCQKVNPCGHPCNGFKAEAKCMPCLHEDCQEKNKATTLGVTLDDFCAFCYTESLRYGACVQLSCKHIFHADCLHTKVKGKWDPCKAINCNFVDCPACNKKMTEEENLPVETNDIVKQGARMHRMIKDRVKHQALIEGLDKSERVTKEGEEFYNKLEEFALFKLEYYQCHKCKLPYYGGMRDCAAGIQQQEADEEIKGGDEEVKEQPHKAKPEDFVCGLCQQDGVQIGMTNCAKHGTDFIMHKCRYCCKTARWFCFGTHHFCEPCHNNWQKVTPFPCEGFGKCPLNGFHAPNGEEFAYGCSQCNADRLMAEHKEEEEKKKEEVKVEIQAPVQAPPVNNVPLIGVELFQQAQLFQAAVPEIDRHPLEIMREMQQPFLGRFDDALIQNAAQIVNQQ